MNIKLQEEFNSLPFADGSDASQDANWVKFQGIGSYIAAGMPKTIEEAERFLQTLRQYDCSHLILLIPISELKEQVHVYPMKEGETISGYLCKEAILDEINWRRKYILLSSDEKHTLTIHHMQGWKDLMPPIISHLKKFRDALENDILKQKAIGPLTVCCKAGRGRTGTYIAIDAALKGKKKPSQIKKLVAVLRKQRPGAIETLEQYQSIFSALQELQGKGVYV